MGFIGDLAQTILITWIAFWVFAIFYFIASGQIAMAVLFIVGLTIPSSMIAYEYWKDKRKKKE